MQRLPTMPVCPIDCFNPHPVWRPGATHRYRVARATRQVSILTRSGDRVQLGFAPLAPQSLFAFQSSPGLETGCNRESASTSRRPACFNPHPVWRPGATPGPRDVRDGRLVSILTRSGDRVQRPSRTGQPGRSWCFNPHPVWRPGATMPGGLDCCCPMFQSSPGLETGCNAPQIFAGRRRHGVSILTRSGDRVQHVQPVPAARVVAVSILTRSGDRVQPACTDASSALWVFQSSPGLETGCNSAQQSATVSTSCFNPHPVWRPGATRCRVHVATYVWFQSSPGLETGCNAHPDRRDVGVQAVSILTRSGDRVQLQSVGNGQCEYTFQSSPGLETGCNFNRSAMASASTRFNPHPVWRPGATGQSRGSSGQ